MGISLTNYFGLAPLTYILGLGRTLVDRPYKVNNTWTGFHDVIKKLIVILGKNCFPCCVIGRIVSKMELSNGQIDARNSDKMSRRFFELS